MRFRFYPTLMIAITAGLLTLLLAACVIQPVQPTPPTPAAPTDTATDAAADASADTAVRDNRQLLARWLHIDPATVTVVKDEAVEWPDACLGVSLPNELCAAAVTPGHKITYQVNGDEYVLHTDKRGARYRLATAPQPQIGNLLLAWGGTFGNSESMEALIGTEGVAFGLSGGRPQIGGKFASEARQAILNEWVSQYAAFDAETDFGSIRLMGTGSTVATPAEQQIIGQWAQLVAMEAAAGEPLGSLRYEGPAEFGSTDTAKCARLELGTPIEASITACDGSEVHKDMGKATYLEWEYLRDHFAPFVYATASETITFTGLGSVTSEPWQRAILAWARTRHAELASGQTSATISTAMSWYTSQDTSQKNICRHLTVLNYGLAYAEERLCEGGDLVNSARSWLTTAELTALDTWLYNRAALYLDNNYIDGKGTQEMSEDEKAEVNTWANDLWARIWQAGNPTAAAPVCAEAHDNLVTVRDFKRGFCLLVPSTHTVFDTDPTQMTIVKESLLNVTDPRLSIVVTPAARRTAEQAADALMAEMAGFDVKRSNAEIAGEQAVILDNVPGQDINRRVLIVHNDRLYDLTFMPMSSAEIETFYTTIIDNLVLVEPEG